MIFIHRNIGMIIFYEIITLYLPYIKPNIVIKTSQTNLLLLNRMRTCLHKFIARESDVWLL